MFLCSWPEGTPQYVIDLIYACKSSQAQDRPTAAGEPPYHHNACTIVHVQILCHCAFNAGRALQ